MLYYSTYASPLGEMLLVSDKESLVGLWWTGQKYFAAPRSQDLIEAPGLPILRQSKIWLEAYFAGKNPSISALSVAPIGNEFRQLVWHFLSEIPYGQCITYGEIAQKVAAKMGKSKMSAQAIGGAVGHNPISIIIPCHRVIGIKGKLTGYAGGLDKKTWLLVHEGAGVMSNYKS